MRHSCELQVKRSGFFNDFRNRCDFRHVNLLGLSPVGQFRVAFPQRKGRKQRNPVLVRNFLRVAFAEDMNLFSALKASWRATKGRMKRITKRGSEIAFGSFALKALEECWITGRQIEAARQAITRHMKREGQLWISIFPDKPVTKKPAEVRMGKGKGTPEYFVARVSPGRIMFEADGVPFEVAKEALRLGAQKLPIATKFVVRRDYSEEI